MINLSTSGNAIVFTFTDSDKYLYGTGTITVPRNSLLLVTDSSNMATFKKAASNDVFVSALYSELGMTKDELISWFEENAVGSTGGGGGGGITSGEVQTMIDESISGKLDASAYTPTVVDSAFDSGSTNPLANSAITDHLNTVESVIATSLVDLDNRKLDASAITTSITSASTDSQVPSAKAVFDAIPTGGGATFDDNFIVPEYAQYSETVIYRYFNLFQDYTCFYRLKDNINNGNLYFTNDSLGETAAISLNRTGSTYTFIEGSLSLIDNFSIERYDIDGMFKITQTANTSDNIYTSPDNDALEAYSIGYTIESGTTEDAIKSAAFNSMTTALNADNELVKNISEFNVGSDNNLKLCLDKVNGTQVSSQFKLTNNKEIYYFNEFEYGEDISGLSLRPVVNSGNTTWSCISNASDRYFNVVKFPNYTFGYKKLRLYLYSGLTISDGTEFQLTYNYTEYDSTEPTFVYDSANDTFVTDDVNMSVTKTSDYIEIEYIGNSNDFHFDHFTSWVLLFYYTQITSIWVYGKQLMTLQNTFDTLNDKFGGLKLTKVTQAEYDALVQAGTVDANTVYFITNSNS